MLIFLSIVLVYFITILLDIRFMSLTDKYYKKYIKIEGRSVNDNNLFFVNNVLQEPISFMLYIPVFSQLVLIISFIGYIYSYIKYLSIKPCTIYGNIKIFGKTFIIDNPLKKFWNWWKCND